MRITVNLRHLEKHGISLVDEVVPEDIELDSGDQLIRFRGAVRYSIHVQKLEQSILAQGHVAVGLECDCARCLTTFSTEVTLPEWVAHLPLSGEDAIPIENDCVDLTPILREDIFLALPQHPLCSKDCVGISSQCGSGDKRPVEEGSNKADPSGWTGLDKLKL